MLANEATALLHGRDAAEAAAETARRTFEEGKKIRAFDAVRVMRELVRCKFSGDGRG